MTGRWLPLLAVQREHWWSQQEDPANPRENCAGYVRLTGAVDAEALATAVVAAHAESEALRVVVREHHGGLEQSVAVTPVGPARVTVPDEASALAWMESAIAVPIDLAAGEPPCSHAILAVGGRVWFLFVRYHHLVLDAYGATRYVARIARHYGAIVAGTPAPPSGFVTLGRLVADEQAYARTPRARRDETYWRGVLAAHPSGSAFAAHDAPPAPRPRYGESPVPESTRAGFRALSRDGVRWPVVVIAAVAGLLRRARGSDDVLLGLPAANRATLGALRTPANLATRLPLPVTVDPGTTVRDLLRHVAVRVTEATTHQRYDPDRLPWVPTLRTYVNVMAFGEEGPEFTGCDAALHVLSTGLAANLRVNCYGHGPLSLRFEANPALYDADRLARHQAELLDALAALVAAPDRPVGAVL